MRILTLNTWGGRAGHAELLRFFREHAESTDVFCLQEIWSDKYEEGYSDAPAGGTPLSRQNIMIHGLQEISSILPDHAAFFRPHLLGSYGLLMLVRKDLSLIREGEIFVHREKGYVPEDDLGHHARNLQYVTLRNGEGLLTLMNFHGLWNGKGKDDCPERLEQSDRILGFLRGLEHPYVLCGDFNLKPGTDSLRKFEEFGLRNLISEYGIASTRTSIYKKPEKFADYVFVSEGVNVRSFEVLPDEVSDHSPLLLDIE